MGKITKENFKEFLGEASARITESERELVAKFLKESKEDKREKAIRKSATKNKRFKGGLMVKPKAAKRGY
jgi:hypothetical protein